MPPFITARRITIAIAGLSALLLRPERTGPSQGDLAPDTFSPDGNPLLDRPRSVRHPLFPTQENPTEVRFDFSLGFDESGDSIPAPIKDSLTSVFSSTIRIVQAMGSVFLKEREPDRPNPFETFRTNLLLDPDLSCLLTTDMKEFLRRAGGSGTRLGVEDQDGGIIVGISEGRIRTVVLFDVRRVQENARDLVGDVDKGFFPVALVVTAHELVGHLPSLLSREEPSGDRRLDEIRAFTRTISFLEFLIATIEKDPSFPDADLLPKVRLALEKERGMLRELTRLGSPPGRSDPP
jgi:hypothetical protein